MRHPRKIPPPTPPKAEPLGVSQHQTSTMLEVQAALMERRLEAVRLYQPREIQEQFHSCHASERILIGGNRSGKTLTSAVEVARAVMGADPHNKYPKENGIIAIIGEKWPHIGMVLYPILFKANAFKIIKDENGWRAFNPLTDDKSKAKPAPPLIPPRMVQDEAWVQKNANYIQSCTLVNGWQMYFFSSEGSPPQGFQADIVWIDEDIANEQWVGEMLARLADRKGRFIWSAMPHSQNDALRGLCERADKAIESGEKEPIIEKFVIRFLDNPYIDAEEKRKNIERWSALGADEVRKRAEGEFTGEDLLMYPSFSLPVHTMRRDELKDGAIPRDWTRYVTIDPGSATMATLFAAVDPQEKHIVFYDELYIRDCNAVIWAEAFTKAVYDQHIRAAILDFHGGRLRDIGSGMLPHVMYSQELRKRRIQFEVGGFSFIPGCDDPRARSEATRVAMHIRPEGSPRLKVLEGTCPNLIRELKRYRKKTAMVGGQRFITDAPQTRGDIHACQAMEMLVAYNPRYHAPPRVTGPDPWWVKWLASRKKKKGEDSCIILGPRGKIP